MLKLYNSLTHKIDEFKPNTKNAVKIFTCGPSIYRRPHIGNYRTFLYEDILIKYLEYSGYKVKRVIPLTDIEDKSIEEARKKNKKVLVLTDDIAKHFFSESKLLKIKLPAKIPRTSSTVDSAVRLIKTLLKSGHAYYYNNDIYFDPLKFKGFGKLYGLDMKQWPKHKKRFKKDTYPDNRWNLGDFIIWFGYREGDIAYWNTAIGKGRPSWNIQDPAAVMQYQRGCVDINCGGIDNIYRHHDYNIAIIESVTKKNFANYYLHGAHLIVNGKTMSKSKGNILYPEYIIKGRYKPHHLRFFLIYKHYRKQLNFNSITFERSCVVIDDIRTTISAILKPGAKNVKSSPAAIKLIKNISAVFAREMDNDLGIGSALNALRDILHSLHTLKQNREIDAKAVSLLKNILTDIDSVAGVLF